jgi:hypothetical protein
LTPPDRIEVRPRTTGEILDDAGRLYLAHAPQLLALSGLFTAPAAVVLLLLLTQPAPSSAVGQLLLPALAAALLPLTGVGAGACQEAFRRVAEAKAPALLPCLAAGLRRGLDHAAARSLVLAAAAPGLLALGATGRALMKDGPDLVLLMLFAAEMLWVALFFWLGVEWHPYLAGADATLAGAGRVAGRTVQVHPGKAAAVVLARLVLHVFVVLNLHLLIVLGVWVAGNLGGLDTALVGVLASLGNPAYVLALVLFGWLLLAPFSEAAGFLLYADQRARYEGLDLWYRVQRHFPLSDRRAGAAVFAVVAALLLAQPARADDARLAVVRQARDEVKRIAEEVRTADPYPGGGRWVLRLNTLADRLSDAGAEPGRFTWFRRGIAGFKDRGHDDALQVLADINRRLALVEETLTLPRETPAEANGPVRRSKEEIKKLLPRSPDGAGPADPAAEAEQRQPERRPVRRDDEDGPGRARQSGPGLVGPDMGCGLNVLGWMVLAGLLAAVLVAAGLLFLRQRRRPRPEAAPETGDDLRSAEFNPTKQQQSAVALWRRAEELARAGRCLEAVRALYLAVLALLHRADLIRYERTQTNGEYLRQLRQSPRADLDGPFRRLVHLFEEKWYGERACDLADFDACRGLAEEIRDGVRT